MEIVKEKITDNLEVNVEIAKGQKEYRTLPANVQRGVIAYAFDLSDEDIEAIKKNKRIYLCCITFGKPMQPMNISLDPTEFDEIIEANRLQFGVGGKHETTV